MEIGGGFHLFALEASNYPLIARCCTAPLPRASQGRKNADFA